MSSYIEFYIRDNEQPHYLCSFTRNSQMYKRFSDYVSYGAFSVVNKDVIANIINDINNEIKRDEDYIKEGTESINRIMSANNSLEEKMEFVSNYRNYINEFKEEIEELQTTFGMCQFLEEIVEEADYSSVRAHDYLWAGIDAVWEGEEND